jgi:hypothetical protein
MPLTADARPVHRNDAETFAVPLAADAVAYLGALICRDSADAGLGTPGKVSTTLRPIGVAQEHVDNSGGADGAVSVRVRRGTWRFKNSAAGDAITAADVGATAYVVDDETVAKTNGTNTRSAAGRIEDVDAAGVWVRVGY